MTKRWGAGAWWSWSLALCFLLALVCPLAPAAAIGIVRVVSPGGIEAWLVEDHKIPVVAFEFSFAGGSGADPAGQNGLANLVADLLDEGAGELDSQAFARRLQDDAISVSFEASFDQIACGLKTLSQNLDSAVELMALALTRPRFDDEAVQRVSQAVVAEIREGLSDPNRVARNAFYAQLYPDHPYGRDPLGRLDTVPTLTPAAMRDFVARQLTRDRLLVAVTGDLTAAQLASVLDRLFGSLPAQGAPLTVAEVTPAHGGETLVLQRPISQSIIMLGQQGVKRADPDWFPAYVMNYVLGGGGFSSRLTEEVREKRGLSYGVYSYLYPFDHGALIAGGGATVNARAGETLALIKQEWARMAEAGISERELADAKTYLTGSFPLQFTSASAIARTVLQVQHDHLGLDYLARRNDLINAVSREDVQRVARRLLDPARLTTVVVGQPQGIANRD